MHPAINTSYELIEGGWTQPAVAELTFMFKYETPGKEGDYLPLCFSSPLSNPNTTSSMELSRTLLPLHSLSLTSYTSGSPNCLASLLKIQISGLQLATMQSVVAGSENLHYKQVTCGNLTHT